MSENGITEIKEGNTLYLEYDGEIHGNGTIVVNSENRYFVTFTDNTYCASKEFNEKKIKVTSGSCSGVVIPG